jgi:hypothetical protein
VNLDLWINVLLVLAVLGAVFNLFVMPFLGRSRTTRSSASTAGTAAPAAPAVAPPGTVAPASGAAQQEVVQETRDRPSL